MKADLNDLLHELARLISVLERKEAALAKWKEVAIHTSASAREVLAEGAWNAEMEVCVRTLTRELQAVWKENAGWPPAGPFKP
jgi:hypothetical protein